ncbi:Uncharacterized protein APZ42_026013 [Daphnia magna]|uniref:Uncharacterized protein n=2 Tax=Daphnia magna TaxID=35525 RepID=A0ABR0AIM6_9CRUS|nr:hypothetical protein OUZ56_010472 [Daphnia magna]KZS09695.1 Uncharacterized protein APZ42_026013 [Daphnia magna]
MFVGSTVVLIARITVSNYQQFDFASVENLCQHICIQPGSMREEWLCCCLHIITPFTTNKLT